ARNAGLSTRQSKKGAHLTTLEREVLRLVVEGRTAKEIAAMLRISPRTSEYHKRQVMHKLGAHNSSDLVRIELRDNFVMEN
ncbi:LuxR C-terminal-related transcriptional regulator, partial [Erwinia amylovora]|uniref:LuxR C-terminal-related transcriptional regulator n=1 Tax=Erwinia amylovora TaxID=552 RepID=UPI0020C0CD8C